jgi:uncharacterized protein
MGAGAGAGPGAGAAGGPPPPPPGAAIPPQGAPGTGQVPPPSATVPGAASNPRDSILAAHLSALIGLVGVPSALGPLVVWLAKRDAHPAIDDQGKEALNFNISAFLYAVVIFAIGFVFSFLTLGIGALLFVPVFLAVFIAWIVMVVIGASRASKGELYRYPLTIRFIS